MQKVTSINGEGIQFVGLIIFSYIVNQIQNLLQKNLLPKAFQLLTSNDQQSNGQTHPLARDAFQENNRTPSIIPENRKKKKLKARLQSNSKRIDRKKKDRLSSKFSVRSLSKDNFNNFSSLRLISNQQKLSHLVQEDQINWKCNRRKKPKRQTSKISSSKLHNSDLRTAQSIKNRRTPQKIPILSKQVLEFANVNRKRCRPLNSQEIGNPSEFKLHLQPIQQQNKWKFCYSDFEMGVKLGSGNFGQVYLVRHKKSGFLFAMKRMSKNKIKQQQYQDQITKQITIQSYLQHPNVVSLYAVLEDFANIYLLMQFCPHGQLFNLIHQKTRLSEKHTSQIISSIACGVSYLSSENVIHRDLKPENIFFTFGLAKIGDFGWSTYIGKSKKLRQTSSGSPLYYSPEIVLKKKYNQKVDIWGIGVISYQCLIGMAPFKVYSMLNLKQIVEKQVKFPEYIEISETAIDFIQRCLKKQAEERASIREVIGHKFLENCIKKVNSE